ncbi:hypothetical protein QE152_g5470 [Popillia japonica]|uniref:Uncharacterized protein n=1 Tax=Popillia japonica TaxID=7064 RepID=A0AAW1MML8_POPJA
MENFQRPCTHNGPTFKCLKIRRSDIIAARKKNQIPDKHVQDRKLSYFCKVSDPKRHKEKYKANCRNKHVQDRKLSYFCKVSDPKRHKEKYKANCRNQHVLSAKYQMVRANGKIHRVCLKMILQCFGISLKRLHTITRNIRFGYDIKERRGEDRRSNENKEKREEVKKEKTGVQTRTRKREKRLKSILESFVPQKAIRFSFKGAECQRKELLLDEPHLDSSTSQEENEPCDCNEESRCWWCLYITLKINIVF